MLTEYSGIIFSDLDGTFLDERGNAAMDANAFASVAKQWRVIWTSSRTAEEIIALQQALGHADDAIGENGAVCVCATRSHAAAFGAAEKCGNRWVARLAAPREDIAKLVSLTFAVEGAPLTLVSELSDIEIARRDGSLVTSAAGPRERRASVLLADVNVNDPATRAALTALRRAGCSVERGGRWVSVVRGADKGSTARLWLARERSHGHDVRHVPSLPVFAIGNEQNDDSLLAIADIAFVIHPGGAHAHHRWTDANAHQLSRPGTEGWHEMIDYLNANAARTR